MAVVSVEAARHVTQPPPRYAEAGLVRRLDELGIGRPSTWTAVLAVLREREYAVLRDRHLAPSEQGRVVTAFLESAFGRWVDYGFTAAMETDLDRIAAGALAWRGMLEGFWAGFRPALDEAGALKRSAVPDARILYVSATGATTVPGLAYARRLGLWASGETPFETRTAFVAAMEAGGVAAMEVVARDLKALGLYQARALSSLIDIS